MTSRTTPSSPRPKRRSQLRDERTAKMLVKVAGDLSRAGVDSVDAEIERALQVLGRRLDIEIVSLLEHDSKSRLTTRHQWRALGWMDPPLEIDTRHANWWTARAGAGEDLVIHDVDDLGVDALHERLTLIKRGTRSLLAVPLNTGHARESYLVLERHDQPRRWRASDIDITSAFAGAIAAAMDRRDHQRAIVQAARRAELASHQRADFLAVLAHEFRGPLTAIIGYAQLLEGEAAPQSTTRERAGHIVACATHLASLAEDALDLARIDAGKLSMSVSDIDVRDVVAAAVATVTPRAQDQGVALATRVPDAPVNARADSRRLCQILINLLDNAVKCSERGGQVTVRVDERNEGEGYAIEVEDAGAGIPAHDRQRIFEAFTRGRDETDDGAGLGLALVQRLCQLHGGRVTLASRDGGSGSLFRVTLPDRPPASPPGRRPFIGTR